MVLCYSDCVDGYGRAEEEVTSTVKQNITERTQTEESLRASELRYRRLFESAKDGILILNAETGKIVDANPYLMEKLGYSYEELVGKELWEIGVLKDNAAAKEAFEELQEKGYIRYDDLPLQTRGGHVAQVEFVSNIYRVGDSKVIQCNIRDITERRAAAEHLVQMEGRYRGLLEAAPDAMVVVDQGGEIVLLNVQAEKQFGYSRDELVGQQVKNIIPEGFAERLIADDLRSTADALAQQIGTGIELVALRKDGSEFPIEIMLSPLESAEGVLVTAAIRDISVRKQAEAEHSTMAAIVESSGDAIVGETLEGIITTWNKSAEHIYGYAAQEVVGRPISILIPASLPDELAVIVEKVGRGAPIKHYETQRARKDGQTIDVSLTVSPIRNADGAVVGASAIARDITELNLGKKCLEETNRKLEATLGELSATTQQLWQASKLATVGELSASIAHELNNPLATVALRVENLLMQMGDEDEQKRHSLEIITQEVDRMAGLVDNLLQFSRRSHRQITTLNVREEIANSIEFVYYHLRTHKIEVVRDFADPLPTIQADRQQLRQIFLNLTTNASDAMPEGGTLTVSAKSSFLHEAEAVQIEFADTGEGIATENLNRIWEPFFTTKSETKGTGLGLAICRRIIEEHGGTIEIESKKGCGITVRILFPATAEEASPNRE